MWDVRSACSAFEVRASGVLPSAPRADIASPVTALAHSRSPRFRPASTQVEPANSVPADPTLPYTVRVSRSPFTDTLDQHDPPLDIVHKCARLTFHSKSIPYNCNFDEMCKIESINYFLTDGNLIHILLGSTHQQQTSRSESERALLHLSPTLRFSFTTVQYSLYSTVFCG